MSPRRHKSSVYYTVIQAKEGKNIDVTAHFSQNFGWINVGPVVGGNLFNLLFGRVYDSHAVRHDHQLGKDRTLTN